MLSVQETQRVDRELSSELKESPVNPAFLSMCAPFKDGQSPLYYLQINGEALWQWREFKVPSQLFDILQHNLENIGYRLSPSSRARVGNNVKCRRDYLAKKVRKISNSKSGQAMRSAYWCGIALHPDEIIQGPGDIINELHKREEELTSENQRTSSELEEKASQLHEAKAELHSVQGQEAHHGKNTADVGPRQKQRHIKELRVKAEKALWFSETYGLLAKSVTMLDTNGTEVNVTLAQDHNAGQLTQPNCANRHNEEETDKIATILYILDRFSISLEGYHELAQVENFLPRTHLIERYAKYLDSQWDIRRTPGAGEGAELAFKPLLECEIRQYLKIKKGPPGSVRVKISGDGTRMSHSSNLFVCTFALVEEDGQNCLSSAGNHTIAVVKQKEEYEVLKASLANIIHDVNAVIKDGHVIVDGQQVEVKFFLGGDYKFLLIAMGMKGATSNNSCIWCKIYKSDRCTMSHSCAYFQSPEMVRTIDDTWSRQPGCHSQPFFSIDLENVILDELHLMLRITDRLEEGVIFEILKWDADDNQKRSARQRSEVHIQDFLSVVRSLGVSFRIYRVGDKWEWTSLLGGEKKLLLSKLPDHFHTILPAEMVEPTKSLWNNFRELLQILTAENLQDEQITAFEAKALSWGKEMVAMSGRGTGYMQTVIITPYMHSLIYHVPIMLRRHGTLRSFSGQGVEKKNDDLRRYFHRKINRWDAATNLLLVEKRQGMLRDKERRKRAYKKHNTSFWLEGGKQEAAQKVPRISTKPHPEPEPEPTSEDPCTAEPMMVESELKRKKVTELIALLEQRTGKKLNKRTRKMDVITALMLSRSRND